MKKFFKKLIGFEIDKSLQCSDWQIRPLPQIMMNYACTDALVLFPLLNELLTFNSSKQNFEFSLLKSDNCYEKLKLEDLVEETQISF